MKPQRPRIRTWLLRLLARRRGALSAIRDVEYVTEVLRFSVLFSALVVVPVALLGMLALRSIQAEEVLVDAGLEQRAEAIASQVQEGLDGLFRAFERDVRARMAAGDLALETLPAEGLSGVFRFDAEGQLVAPFRLAQDDDRWTAPGAGYDRAWREGREAEADGDLARAVAAYGRAETRATTRHHVAEARFARARARLEAGDARAIADLVLLAAAFPDARERRGHRIADLVTLLRAQAADDPEVATALLRGLVDRGLVGTWFVGLPGDAFVAEAALGQLRGRMDGRAWDIAAARLATRIEQLHWASMVEDELRLVGGRPRPGNGFVYAPEERALWVTARNGDVTWAFSFDYDGVQRELARSVVDVAGKVDPDLTATLVRARDDIGTVLARRSLAPELPRSAVVVRPTDPEQLAERRRRTRTQRSLVIVLSVLAASLGMFAAARSVNRELDSARQRADFAANVSHELRSPLTQIRLKAESLQLDLVFDDDDRRAHYDAIVREAERLSRLVDNVLDFSSIERGVKKYSLRPDDLGEILMKGVAATEAAARTAGMRLILDVPDDLPVVWVDREAMGQVMTNLLSNAVKYGAGGDRVEVIAREGLDGVEVSVRDHGIGIAPEDQAKVFEHFFRVSSADVRRQRGTGIGLTIVRYIVEAHGGTITVESELGKGSTFTVTLPMEPPPGAGG